MALRRCGPCPGAGAAEAGGGVMQAEERALWAACKGGDQRARTALVSRYLRLVDATRRRAFPGVNADTAEELEAEGRLALVKAVDRFDPERGIGFPSYAITWIKGAMREERRRDDWLPRSVRQRLNAGSLEPVIEVEVVSLDELLFEGGQGLAVLDHLADPDAPGDEQITLRLAQEVAGRLALALPRAERRVI